MPSKDIYHINNSSPDSLQSRIDHFIQKSKEKFGDQFSYELTQDTYTNSHGKVKLTCKEHGEIEMVATKHLSGKFGCYQCAMIGKGKSKRLGMDKCITRFKETHGEDRYDYSMLKDIKYESIYQKVPIICHEHTPSVVFHQQINKHIWNRGCPVCGQRDWLSFGFFDNNPEEKDKPACIYLLRLYNETDSFIKVGISKEPHMRYRAYERDGYSVTKLFESWSTYFKCYEIENLTLSLFMGVSHKPKQKFGGYTECFKEQYENQIVSHLEDMV